jgi:hypothetical protein
MPSVFPVVLTLVATKSFSCNFSFVAISPVTISDCPYAGAVSISFPPSFARVATTCSSGSRSEDALLKIREVPKPITGSISPEEGMARCRRVRFSCAGRAGATSRLAVVPAINRAASRRDMSRLIP